MTGPPHSFDVPIRFAPQILPKPWGDGSRLRHMGLAVPEDPPTGEVWLVSDVPGRSSVIVSGPGRGGTLEDLLRTDRASVLGDAESLAGRFPLLVKLLDVRGALSVQVHPDAEQARRNGDGAAGKFEAWTVVAADRGSRATLGLDRELTTDQVRALIAARTLDSRLNTFDPVAGDAYVITPGTIHAASGGLVLFEVQETSDVTYRLYDWGTVGLDGRPRELHLEKSLDVADLTPRTPLRPAPPVTRPAGAGVQRRTVVPPGAGPFVYDLVDLEPGARLPLGGDRRPWVIAVLAGAVQLGPEELRAGDAALLPAVARAATVVSLGGRSTFAIAAPSTDHRTTPLK